MLGSPGRVSDGLSWWLCFALVFPPANTRMRWSWDLEPDGVLKPLGPLIAYIGRRKERTIWTGLKHHLEAHPN